MITNNKILTVSYGTFSCTLEGFDDSFGTMKAIAEYFRDLASDDRYFGAEPPQPDAEMLTRIAQKEISRRVEAREHDGKIVLSATDAQHDALLETTPAAETADQIAAQAEADRAAQAEAETQAEIARVQAEAEAAASETARVQAAALAEAARAEENRLEAERLAALDVETTSAPVDDASNEDAPVARDLAEELPEASAFFASSPTGQDISLDEDDIDNIASPAASLVDSDKAVEPKADSIAAKLQRIRAVVSQADLASDDDDFSEDEHAEEFASSAILDDVAAPVVDAEVETAIEVADETIVETAIDDDITTDEAAEEIEVVAEAAEDTVEDTAENVSEDVAEDIAEDVAEDSSDFDITDFSVDVSEQVETTEADVQADAIADISAAIQEDDIADAAELDMSDDDNDVASILANLEAEVEGTTNLETPAETLILEESDAVSVEDPQDGENLFDDSLYASDDSDLDDALEDNSLEDGALDDGTHDDDAIVEISVEDPTEDASFDDDALDMQDEGQPEPARVARVIKVKRSDLEAAIEQGNLEEIEDDGDYDGETDSNSSLSADEEAELAKDLAEVEAGLEGLEADLESETDSAYATAQSLPAIDEQATEDDLTRLMAQADQQMDEEEGKQSRDAFAHLRAAVVAKKSDSGLDDPTAEEVQGAYRSDLATAVKPRRPSAGGDRSERPVTTERPAPLKLVAEQRIDTPEMSKRGPVQPRRVALQEASNNPEATNFVDYAEEMGASELPDLLEAAAAYMSFVEGRAQFSRPQLMNVVRSMNAEGFSREDGLRSFGKLLRAGKIEKVKGGRFTVTGDIGYRPDARAAG